MKNKLSVLLIEDNESDAELIIRQLEKGNYQVISQRVETAEQLKKMLQEHTWDIVFSDYHLPELDAIGSFNIFKSFNLDIPFIIISGAIGEEAAVAMIKLGVKDYLIKGNLHKLVSVVKHELEEISTKKDTNQVQKNSGNNFFKTNLEYLLKINGIKQVQLARDTGIAKQSISDWLNKDSLINIQQALKLASYFNITVDEFFVKNLSAEAGRNLEYDQLKNINTPLHTVDFDGTFSYANQAFAAMLGFSKYDLNSRFFCDLIHPEDIARIRIMRKKSILENIVPAQIDMRYISTRGGFTWINNTIITSPVDKRLYVFSYPVKDEKDEKYVMESLSLKDQVLGGLENLQLTVVPLRTLKFIDELDPKIEMCADRNVFKCLMRSLFFQFLHVDFESESKFEILLQSREEKEKVLLCATIKCGINPKRLDLSRVNKVAELIGAEVYENYAGNIYSVYMAFKGISSN